MKTFLFRYMVPVFLMLIPLPAGSWGFFAHSRINRLAVFLLPDPLFGFYKQHLDYMTDHAADPDKRRYAVEGEAECHFIDLDRYGSHPFDTLPVKWNDAVALFGEDSLRAHGILPWNLYRMTYKLTAAFQTGDLTAILKTSADMGHYIGDAHVPLHCTRNYNGQLTNQHGIHGLWESNIPELLFAEWDFLEGNCVYQEHLNASIWQILKGSYATHDSVLSFEAKLTAAYADDAKYAISYRNNAPVKTYSERFTEDYDRKMKGMVERRMQESVQMVASFIYTCWVNAGQPELGIMSVADSTGLLNEQQQQEQLWQSKSLKVRSHE